MGAFAQVHHIAPGAYVGPTGFVDNFTNPIASWTDSAYFWTTGNPTVYSVSQTGNGQLTVGVTAGSPNYESFAAYGINHTFAPVNISGTGNRKVTITMTNTSTSTAANVRIILMGVNNRDTVDINSSAAANSGGYGTWFKINPPLASPETRTVTFDFSTPYLEHTASDNPRFPHNLCTSSSPDYYTASSTCVTAVEIDSIIGFRMWINAGANPNTAVWPNYNTYTGTITIDKLVIGSDPSITTGIKNANAYLGVSSVFPNPSSGKSDVSFSLKNSGNVKIDIKDSRGMLMMNVSNEMLIAGDHQLPLNTSDLANGLYYLTFQFEDGSMHADKLVILK